MVTVEGPEIVRADQLFTVVVSIKNIVSPGVFGAQFSLRYQPDYLEIVDLTPNRELLVISGAFDNERGQLEFAASRHTDVPNFTDDVDFVTIIFRAKAVTANKTVLELKNVKLGAKGGISVPAMTQDLRVSILPGG